MVLIVILNHGNKEEGFAQLCRVVGGIAEEGEVTAYYSMP